MRQATADEVAEALAAAQQPSPIVVFKKARTGSTWLADMLTQDERVAFFRHDVDDAGALSLEKAADALESIPRAALASAAHGREWPQARRVG